MEHFKFQSLEPEHYRTLQDRFYSSVDMASPISHYQMDNQKIKQLHFAHKFKLRLSILNITD